VQAFELLRTALGALPLSEIRLEAGLVFGRLAVERPALYSIGIQHDFDPGLPRQIVCDVADAALAVLVEASRASRTPGCSASRTVNEATRHRLRAPP